MVAAESGVMTERWYGARRRGRYRVRDWATYDRALTRRGDVTVRVSPDAVRDGSTRRADPPDRGAVMASVA